VQPESREPLLGELAVDAHGYADQSTARGRQPGHGAVRCIGHNPDRAVHGHSVYGPDEHLPAAGPYYTHLQYSGRRELGPRQALCIVRRADAAGPRYAV